MNDLPDPDPIVLGAENTQYLLFKIRSALGLRNDWHEPDNQEVDLEIIGSHFDNAGHYDPRRDGYDPDTAEICAVIRWRGQPIAIVNMANLMKSAASMKSEYTATYEDNEHDIGKLNNAFSIAGQRADAGAPPFSYKEKAPQLSNISPKNQAVASLEATARKHGTTPVDILLDE